MATKKKVYKRPPSHTVFFGDDLEIHKQITADAERIGIAVSSLLKLALDIGYPVVRENFERMLSLPKTK